MKTITIVGIVAAVLALIILLAAIIVPITVKNGLIAKDEAVNEQWAQIDTQLQRRADLIPNLISTVKGYAKHEKTIFTQIADARSKLLSAQGPAAKAQASGELNSAIGRLLAIAENYPNLKADQSFVRLQDELAGTENRIAVARTRYNKAARAYNQAIRQFPGSLFASSMERQKAEYYEPPNKEALQKPPTVKFD